MSFTEITPYGGQLPSSSDPASFDGRASALMSWLVANFAPEIQALAVEIATALNGEEDTLAAVQTLSDSLKSAAHYNANDDEDFTVDPNALPTRAAVAGYVGDEIGNVVVDFSGGFSDIKGSRSLSTAYQNTTGKSFMLVVSCGNSGGNSSLYLELSSDGVTWYRIAGNRDTESGEIVHNMIVPDGMYYRATGSSINSWMEIS